MVFGQERETWKSGVGSYDGVILGLLWGGVLSEGEAPALLFPLALLVGLALQAPLRRLFSRLALPPLAMPGLLTVWLCDAVFTVFGEPFWIHPGPSLLGSPGEIAAIIIIVAVAARHSPRGAVMAVLFAAMAAVLSGLWYREADGIGPAGLWAITVAPAVYAVAGVILPVGRRAALTGLLAGLMSTIIWFGWLAVPGLASIPPLLAPLFLAVWLALWAATGKDRRALAEPSVVEATRKLFEIQRRKGKTILLSGAGISTASGIPDYMSGAWMDSKVPVQDFSFQNFLSREHSRRLTWRSCARFRETSEKAEPNPAHEAVTALESLGYIAKVITQNVDGLHERAGTQFVLPLTGKLIMCTV